MNKFLVIIFLVISYTNNSQAQLKEYVVIGDSALVQGEIVYNKANPTEVEFLTVDQKQQTYSANEVTEFRLKEGKKYVSRRLLWHGKEQNAFLEVLEPGKMSLLRLKSNVNQYYLEKDSLIALNEINYIEIIKTLPTQCNNWNGQYKNIVLNRRSLLGFVKNYNSGTCKEIAKTLVLNKENKFVSRKMLLNGEIKKVILETLVEGKISFLRLNTEKDVFYLEHDSLISLNKSNYIEIFKDLPTKCVKWKGQYKHIVFNKNSLSNFIKKYNSNSCKDISRFNYGPKIGKSYSKLSMPKPSFLLGVNEDVVLYSENLNVGIYIEKPLYKVQGMSLIGEVQYQKQLYEKEFHTDFFNHNMSMEMSFIGLSVEPKYSFSFGFIKPYFFAVGYFNYYINTLSNSTATFKLNQSIKTSSDFIQVPDNFGVNIGAGIELYYRKSNFIGFEILKVKQSFNNGFTLITKSLSIKANF